MKFIKFATAIFLALIISDWIIGFLLTILYTPNTPINLSNVIRYILTTIVIGLFILLANRTKKASHS